MICNGQTNRNCRSKQCVSNPGPKRHRPGHNRNKRPQRHKDQHQVNAMTTPRQKQRRRHIEHKQRNRGNRNHERSEPQHNGTLVPSCSKHRHICAVQLQQRLRNGNRGQRQIHSTVPKPLGWPLFLLCLVIPHSYRTVAPCPLTRSSYRSATVQGRDRSSPIGSRGTDWCDFYVVNAFGSAVQPDIKETPIPGVNSLSRAHSVIRVSR